MKNKKVRGFELVKGVNGKLPVKSTKYSAGVDFFASCDVIIPTFHTNGKATLVPTGVKAYMPKDEYLLICSRSSIPLKLGLFMSNGVGIIDSDYYNNPNNEGHIMIEFTNLTNHHVLISKGTKIAQGIFHKVLPVDNVIVLDKERKGGLGSTGNK